MAYVVSIWFIASPSSGFSAKLSVGIMTSLDFSSCSLLLTRGGGVANSVPVLASSIPLVSDFYSKSSAVMHIDGTESWSLVSLTTVSDFSSRSCVQMDQVLNLYFCGYWSQRFQISLPSQLAMPVWVDGAVSSCLWSLLVSNPNPSFSDPQRHWSSWRGGALS